MFTWRIALTAGIIIAASVCLVMLSGGDHKPKHPTKVVTVTSSGGYEIDHVTVKAGDWETLKAKFEAFRNECAEAAFKQAAEAAKTQPAEPASGPSLYGIVENPNPPYVEIRAQKGVTWAAIEPVIKATALARIRDVDFVDGDTRGHYRLSRDYNSHYLHLIVRPSPDKVGAFQIEIPGLGHTSNAQTIHATLLALQKEITRQLPATVVECKCLVVAKVHPALRFPALVQTIAQFNKAGFNEFGFAPTADDPASIPGIAATPQLPAVGPETIPPDVISANFGLTSGGSGYGPNSRFFGTGAGSAYHIVYCIDTSMRQGSDLVRRELLKSFSRLSPRQTFHVILFDSTGSARENPPAKLVAATDDAKKVAADFIKEAITETPTTTTALGALSGSAQPVPAATKPSSPPPPNPLKAISRAFEVFNDPPADKNGKWLYLLTDRPFNDNDAVRKLLQELNPDQSVSVHPLLYGSHNDEFEQFLKAVAGENNSKFRFVPVPE